jgi:murein DD-endopeptidase MepM/ murein hydrolase activator NlpD
MKKIKYFYNTHTLRFEKLITPLRVKLLRFFGIISGLLVAATLTIYIYVNFFPKPEEFEQRRKMDALKENYAQLAKQVKSLQQEMSNLERRDNEVYRSIFEANPVPDSARAKLIEKQEEFEKIQVMDDAELGSDIANQLNNISSRMIFQKKSYENIAQLINRKDEKLASIPAIQPVSNKQLNRIASGFGTRIDPIYGTPKMHKGLDFTAPQGTPIYATGNGVVKVAGGSDGGYGNHVVINHGYGYQTLYGHMVRIKARAGQRVKRGEVIGWVGSTGKSTGPHCHYEVLVNNNHVDPVYFFYNDLNAEQYDRLLKIASTGSAKSFD